MNNSIEIIVEVHYGIRTTWAQNFVNNDYTKTASTFRFSLEYKYRPNYRRPSCLLFNIGSNFTANFNIQIV